MRLVDADALMGRIIQRSQALITPNGKAGYLGLFVKDIQQVVDVEPTINPDDLRPHGRWLPTNDNDKKRCSRCDVIHLIAQYPYGQANCCPNCGALMDGANEPLTLDELRQMDEEPVYVQIGDGREGYVILVWEYGSAMLYGPKFELCEMDQDFYNMVHNDPDGHFGLHVLGWLAYRHKPAHGKENE